MKEKILIIDRERDIRETLEIILRKDGYVVRGVSGGEEAIDALKFETTDLVIMDINMPGADGIQVMRKIMELDEDMKVIVLTGLTSIDNAVQTLRCEGAFDFLSKPLENDDQLITIVKQALTKRRMNIKKNASVRKLRNHQPAGKKILIVEDDTQIQDSLTEMLLHHQYDTEVASDGFEAGIKALEFKPDIIILDLFMPGMSGFEVCKQIKQNSSTSQIKILAITGYDTEENRTRILAAGADDYMAKPLNMNTLFQRVQNLFNHVSGDAIMAMFGVFNSKKDHATHAMKTAIEMQAALERLMLHRKKKGKETYKVSIGVNTGKMVIGNVGTKRMKKYTVTGSPVNIASR